MRKVYGIYEYRYANEVGKMIAMVSSKTKAVDYIKACVSNDNTKFRAIEKPKTYRELIDKWCYDEKTALTVKNILNYKYLGSFYNYYVETLEIL